MAINKTKLAVGALAGLAAGAAAMYLADNKNRQIVKRKARGLQKQGMKVLEQVQEQRQALPKKAKAIKRTATRKIKAVRKSSPLNHRVIHS